MTPLVFGRPARRMIGIFHQGESVPASRAAVLICAPFGHELMRSQRFFRVLADRLARAGIPVLRFDYHGCGDSPGEDLDGDFDGWTEDVGAAHEELHRLTGTHNTVWLGARLGATLALTAARRTKGTPSRILAWDPVIDGCAYLNELRVAHVDAMERSYCVPDRRVRRLLGLQGDAGTSELLGTALSPLLRKQLLALKAVNLQITAQHDTTVLAAPEDLAARQWVDAQVSRELPVRLSSFKHPLVWTLDPNPQNAMVPAEALQRLLAELRE